MSYHIYHNVLIKTSPKEVFIAISEPKHINKWWTKECSGVVALDATYNLYFSEEYNWYGKVSTCEINKAFAIKMTQADTDWNPTTFGFELGDHEEGTYVRFSHINWPKKNDHFKHSSFCWALLLDGLKKYIEDGIVIPFEDRS